MVSKKCFTRFEQPFFIDGNYIMNCEVVSKEGIYKNISFKVLEIFIEDSKSIY